MDDNAVDCSDVNMCSLGKSISGTGAYLGPMRSTFHPCLPTAGKVVPATPNWLHEEVKYDGYRLIVARGGDRVRLVTRWF